MLVETYLPDVDWQDLPKLAAAAEAIGADAIAHTELTRDPFLALAVIAAGTRRVELATSVAVAFSRSPTATAYLARNLCDLTGGRFVLGLGTQVKAHIERRFGVEWSHPGPRLREYVEALRAVWHTWDTGEPLRYQGRFYHLSLMTPAFSPPPSRFDPIRIEIAAVNPYNIELAGELCDGLRVHPLATPAYIRDVIRPHVERGAARAGRSLATFRLVGGGFLATGPDDATVHREREDARRRIGFYASTPAYRPVLAHHGWEALHDELRRLAAAGRWDDLAAAVSDEVIDAFCTAGTFATVVERFRARLAGVVDVVALPLPDDFRRHSTAYATLIAGLKTVPAAAARHV
ncbi:MAG TPA: TIGR03617 family F420-dependent LLM class oxidoreductase [Thermomicrobiales bacterium]|jgi:probable F420-dependent oxidoreductase